MDTREKEIKRLEKRRSDLETAAVCNWARHEHVAKLYAAVMAQLRAAYCARNMPLQEAGR